MNIFQLRHILLTHFLSLYLDTTTAVYCGTRMIHANFLPLVLLRRPRNGVDVPILSSVEALKKI